MKIEKDNFLIQVKYSDLLSDPDNIEKHFFGFGGEIYLSVEEMTSCNPQIIGRVKSFTERDTLSLRLHAPVSEIDYSKPQKTTYDIKSLYNKVFALCDMLNINSIVTHAEFNYETSFTMDGQLEEAFSLWGAVCGRCSARSIYLNIENHYEKDPNHLVALAKKINLPYFGICVDAGHINTYSDLSIKEWIEKLPAGSIKEVHLADNKGDGDTHLPLGDGNIDFLPLFEILEKRNEKCVFVLEPRYPDEVQKSISFLIKEGFLG